MPSHAASTLNLAGTVTTPHIAAGNLRPEPTQMPGEGFAAPMTRIPVEVVVVEILIVLTDSIVLGQIRE